MTSDKTTHVTGVTEEFIEVETADGPMAVLSKQPSEESDRLVVMFHDGPGIRDATHEFARKLAADGYRVVIPDLYHRHGRLIGFTPEQTRADRSLVDRIWEMIRSLSDDGIQSDLDATLGALPVVPDRFAVLGFCLGARAVCRTMMRLPERAVVGAAWHPSFLVDDQARLPAPDRRCASGHVVSRIRCSRFDHDVGVDAAVHRCRGSTVGQNGDRCPCQS